MKTVMVNQAVERWYVVDAAGKTLGRLASQIASHLRGKTSASFTPHALPGKHVIVLNAAQVRITSRDKTYSHYTGYPGGLKTQRFEELLSKFPARIIEKAVKGMLPKNPLGRMAFRRLKVYEQSTHPHSAQQPQPLELS